MADLRELSVEAAAGRAEAFSQLMRETKTDLYRFIRRYVGDADEAYDLLQEAYAAAWLAIRRYDPQRPFEAWLRTIAVNKCRDWSRRRRVRRFLVRAGDLSTPEALAIADEARDAADSHAMTESLKRLDAAIARLPSRLKEPLLLTAIEERSQAETASILGVSVKTIETRVARARRKLAYDLGTAEI